MLWHIVTVKWLQQNRLRKCKRLKAVLHNHTHPLQTTKGVLPNCGRTPYFHLTQYNFTQTKRPEVRKNTDSRSFFRTKPQATKKASPWGEVPSLSRRRGVMTIKRKNCSPLSVALTGASSPLGEPFSAYTASGNQAFKKAASLQR